MLKVDEVRLTKLLEGNRQFVVPIYQRTYDWYNVHCKQLYDDIVEVGNAEDNLTHFIGAITYHSPHEAIQPVSRHQLIDGQQRITTLMLLLVALKRVFKEQISKQQSAMIDQLMYNAIEPEHSKRHLKIRLNDDDRLEFEEILKSGQAHRPKNIHANYNWLCKQLEQSKNTRSLGVILRGIQRLTIVHIEIGDQDNAQRIFESMNSTGLDLSKTDLIQNFLLMANDPEWQNLVYEKYWLPMEKIFEGNLAKFDNYFRCYLIMKNRSNVTKKQVYYEFKKYSKQLEKKDLLVDLLRHAKLYDILALGKPHSSDRLNEALTNIRSQDTDVADPLLLKTLNDYEDGLIDEESAIGLFELVDSYLLRCTVVGTAKNLNRAIPVVMSELNTDNYIASIRDAIMKRTGRDRFPSNTVFEKSLTEKEFYRSDAASEYIINRIAHKYQGKDIIKFGELEFEHIMPQTLSNKWKECLGDAYEKIHDLYLRKIGNITLVEENQSLSNNSFDEKQKLYKDSAVKMTIILSAYKNWTAVDIDHRSRELADKAIRIWPYPEGYRDRPIDDESTTLEQSHLTLTEKADLWHELKKRILDACPGTIFAMTRTYANFKYKAPSSNKYGIICSINAHKFKIYVVYNTTATEGVINTSDFVEDITRGHLGIGNLRSTVYSSEEASKATELVKSLWRSKHSMK